jgi:hypothetical protein
MFFYLTQFEIMDCLNHSHPIILDFAIFSILESQMNFQNCVLDNFIFAHVKWKKLSVSEIFIFTQIYSALFQLKHQINL